MSKQKTIKAVAKRVRITKNKKVIKKKCGQDHFNSREPGKVTRKKRRPVQFTAADRRNIMSFIPHN
ncbi:MAG: 50S ribosomal protein L35 [Parcubacteria group bacterium]